MVSITCDSIKAAILVCKMAVIKSDDDPTGGGDIYTLNSPITKIKLFNSPITKNADLFHDPLSCFTKIILYDHHSPS